MQQKSSKFLISRQGTSLIIVLGIISMMLVLALGVSHIIVASIRQTVRLEDADQASFASEGGVEKALLEGSKYGPGYSSYNLSLDYQSQPKGTGTAPNLPIDLGTGARTFYSIQGRIPNDLKYEKNPPGQSINYENKYTVPRPGTGTAGKDCNFYEPILSLSDVANAGASSLVTDPADHSCNWSKLKPGDSVAIPLFIDTGTDQAGSRQIDNPANRMNITFGGPAVAGGMGLTEIVMRFRAPCKDGSANCVDSDRWVFHDAQATNGDNDVIALWSIVGTKWDNSGLTAESLYLEQMEDESSPSDNSAVLEKFLNSDKTLQINQDKSGLFQGKETDLKTIKEVLNIAAGSDTIHKPVLKIAGVHSLMSNDNTPQPIPYLEYQVITDKPLADSVQTIVAEGFQGGVKQSMRIQQAQDKSILDFVIEQ